MTKISSSRLMSSGLLAILVAGTAASSVACSKAEEPEKKAAWSCVTGDVPLGETVRCTQSALTADGPVAGTVTNTTTDGTTGGAGGTADGTTNVTTDGTTTGGATTGGTTGGAGGTADGTGGVYTDSVTTYDCVAGGPDCPPVDGSGGGAGGAADGTTNGTVDTTTAGNGNGAGGNGSGSNGSGAGGGAGSSSGGPVSTDGSSSGTGQSSSGGGGGSSRPGPDECAFVPDLEYCAGLGGGGGTSSGTSDGATTGSGGAAAGECTNPKGLCGAPGQAKKNGTTDGTTAGSSSGSSGSGSGTGTGTSGGTTDGSGAGSSGGASSSGGTTDGSGGGKGKKYHCEKDSKGNKSCESIPDCVAGTHPSACGACVPDSEGDADCVPPVEGGCWVTGGGFIEAASLVPNAPADGHDNFGGNAKPMKKGYISGHWNHVDHGTGNHAKGRPEYIFCRTVDGPGPKQPGGKKGMTTNQVYFGGHAEWREAATGAWADGYWFDVVANDHGEPGTNDKYHFSIRKISDPAAGASGTVVYDTKGTLVGGNIQIHPSNPGHPAVQSELPAWVALEP